MRRRDETIDILRFIGITCIILAHVIPPPWLNQMRNFDVPLMVFLSGISFRLSGGLKESYTSYISKRIVRLLIPTWIFLSLYLSLKVSVLNDHISWKEIIRIFLLTDKDFGFIWIIRVFFLIAILSPVLSKLTLSLSKYSFLLFCILGFVLTDLLSQLSQDYVFKVIIMMIPYSLVFCIGIVSAKLSKMELILISIFCMVTCLIYAAVLYHINGHFIQTQDYKEPPKTYYISYAVGVSLILFLFRNKICVLISQIKLQKQFLFIGRHTIWIYFWHIPLLTVFRGIDQKIFYFVLVYSIAIVLTYVQSKMVILVCNSINNERINKNIIRIFNG